MRLRTAIAAMALAALACDGLYDDGTVQRALDYKLDRPRLLAIAVTPTVLQAGVEAHLETLVLGPGDAEGGEATWKTCGLDVERSVSIYDLSCFSDDLDVSVLASGADTTWTPPEPPACEDTGWGCSGSFLPFLVEVQQGDETVRGTFFASISASASSVSPLASWRDLPLTLTASEPEGGEVTLTATLGKALQSAVFRWYVDDGTLLDTGRTAIQASMDDSSVSTNRWVLPEGAGPWRAVVVVSADEAWGGADTATWYADEVVKDTADTWTWTGSETPNMTWAILSVSAP